MFVSPQRHAPCFLSRNDGYPAFLHFNCQEHVMNALITHSVNDQEHLSFLQSILGDISHSDLVI